jgi:hypothetical protein
MAIAKYNIYEKSADTTANEDYVPDGAGHSFVAVSGHTLVVAVAWRSVDTGAAGVHDEAGNTYSSAGSYTNSDWTVGFWVCPSSVSHAANWATVTWATASNNYHYMFLLDMTGVDSVDTGFDPATTGASGTAASCPTTADTTAVANEWLIGCWINWWAAETYSAAGGCTNLTANSGGSANACIATQEDVSAGSNSIAVTKGGTSNTCIRAAIALKPVAAASSPSSSLALLLGVG